MEEPLGDDVLRMRVAQVRVALGHVEVERGEVEQTKVQKGEAAQQANKQEPRKKPRLFFSSKKARFIGYFSDQNIALSLFGVYVLARYFVPLKLSRSLNSDSSMADSDMPGEVFLVRGRLFEI